MDSPPNPLSKFREGEIPLLREEGEYERAVCITTESTPSAIPARPLIIANPTLLAAG